MKLCTTMRAADVTNALHLALQAADLDQADRAHRSRLLSDNGPSYVAPFADALDSPHQVLHEKPPVFTD